MSIDYNLHILEGITEDESMDFMCGMIPWIDEERSKRVREREDALRKSYDDAEKPGSFDLRRFNDWYEKDLDSRVKALTPSFTMHDAGIPGMRDVCNEIKFLLTDTKIAEILKAYTDFMGKTVWNLEEFRTFLESHKGKYAFTFGW